MKSCTRIAATVLLGLAGALVTASCVQGSPPAPEAAGVPTLSTEDEDDPFGGDPDVGGSIGSEAPSWDEGSAPSYGGATNGADGSVESGNSFAYKVCVFLKCSPTMARLAFCASQPQSDVRARCRAHVHDSPVSWANWCYNEFAE